MSVRTAMTEQEIAFWEHIDDRILDTIALIRAKYVRFNGSPIEKVVVKLFDAYRASEKVVDAYDKGWLHE